VRRAGVYAGACDINVKATSGQRTIATAKIVEDALAASTSLFKLKLAAFGSLPEAPEGFTKQADSGNPLTRYFCPECGSPLYTVSPVHPEVLYVKAGTLDDPRLVQPRRQNWMQSRVSWTTVDPELPGSPKNPEGRA
jgi:hypothetical protein